MFASYLNQTDCSNWFFPTYFGVSSRIQLIGLIIDIVMHVNHLDEHFVFVVFL